VHESRVVRFDGAPVDFLMRRRLLGWTLSCLQAPYDTLRQFDTSFQGVSNLMADVAQAVMKINGLSQLISNDQRTLQTRMAMVDRSRSVGRMLYVDAENESFERVPTPMTGVADVLEMQMLRCSAAAEMPVAILFGREPSGLNATGDADFRRFYDVISGRQKYELEPKLRRLYTLICLAADSPLRGKLPARGLEFIWHALYCPSEKEQAEIRWLMAQADEKYVQNEILLPEEVAMSRFRNGELGLDTEIQTNLRIEALDSAELPPSGAEKAKQALKAASLKDASLKDASLKDASLKDASLKDGPPEASK
jgi:phage-related protein (TIGR01555 family)